MIQGRVARMKMIGNMLTVDFKRGIRRSSREKRECLPERAESIGLLIITKREEIRQINILSVGYLRLIIFYLGVMKRSFRGLLITGLNRLAKLEVDRVMTSLSTITPHQTPNLDQNPIYH